MNAQAICWLVFLAVIKSAFIATDFSHAQLLNFKLPNTNLTAQEGSCIEINCKVLSAYNVENANWFWIKGAYYHNKNYAGTIIYSKNYSTNPVSPGFAGRVKYIGSPSSSWEDSGASKYCSILICNLNKSDSGNYSFRFVGDGTVKWITKPPVILTVTENPCPITFEEPPVVKESDMVTLTCSTLSSCTSSLQVEDLTPSSKTLHPTPQQVGKRENTISFKANWQDDGRKFSCQTEDNADTYLIRNISLTVEYAPRDAEVKMTPLNIMEGETVTLTCSAKGHPDPTFTWFKKEQQMNNTGAEWKIQSIMDSESGEYHCEANNKHGTMNSTTVIINVTYAPQVEVTMSPSANVVKEGEEITLTCNVKRSNPQPHAYVWFRDRHNRVWQTYQYVKRIVPEDHGSYTCTATNTAGTGTSEPLSISVQYSPRNTEISSSQNDQVKVNTPLIFHCTTDANPVPFTYSWSRYTKDFSEWMSYTTSKSQLRLENVQRTDEACYMCNATNAIGTGQVSKPLCIHVLYPPINVVLSVDAEVVEGQTITIRCTTESFPLSSITIKRNETLRFFQETTKILQKPITVTSDDTGLYTCIATNSEGSKESISRKLVVKHRPKDVRVEANPDLTVNENAPLTLTCSCKSYPAVTSVTWTKMANGKSEIQENQTIKLKSVGTSDSGLYSCTATNEIGTGQSAQVEVKVKHAPRDTKITKSATQLEQDGTRLVKLSCSSRSYPPVQQYSWYRKMDKGKDIKLSYSQNYTVSSHKPGIYYCIAKNEINQQSSAPVELFVDRGLMKLLYLLPIILLVIVVLVFVHRHKRKKSIQRRTTNASCCFGFPGWWNCRRRMNLMNDPVIAEPFRSRDDLLPQQSCQPKAQRRQPRPDSTPASHSNDIYSIVNLPTGKHGPSAQKPIRQQGRHTEDESLNYASLHFGNDQTKQTTADENIVYAVVSKLKSPNKNQQERLADYENVSAVTSPNPLDSDTDTSEDEVNINYSQVSFKAKPGCQKASRDSSSDDSTTSDEEETQYSEVKI